ncbi:hypothetical protein Taro_039435 [Colocasia esculenta]|uniref:Uncharacterized protein n=1 Tax=Colocasia esculenta TaxID=4460 RepID=A0A843WGM7_COLES|nr:hypothetical protein [Colocasia esculenta]
MAGENVIFVNLILHRPRNLQGVLSIQRRHDSRACFRIGFGRSDSLNCYCNDEEPEESDGKAQLLEDAMETAETIKGKSVKREQVSGTERYQPTIGMKRPSGGVNEPADKKPKELGKQIVVATAERISDCPLLKEQAPQDKHLNGQKRQGRLQAIQEPEAAEEGAFGITFARGDVIPVSDFTSALADAILSIATVRPDVISSLTSQPTRSDEELEESDGAGQE